MERKKASLVMLTILLIGTLAITFNVQPVKAELVTIVVPDNYPTIQEAINNAYEGDTIYVRSGVYEEPVVVDKSVSLVGENRETTIIDGQGTGTVVTISANGVAFSGFALQNGGAFGVAVELSDNCDISKNLVRENSIGIRLWFSNNCVVSENIATNNREHGISLDNAHSAHLIGNTVNENSGIGILLAYSDNARISNSQVENNDDSGILIDYSRNSTVIENNVTSNGVYGIILRFSDISVTSRNSATNNILNGIELYASNNARVSENNIRYNGYYGVRLTSSSNNKIYHNNFFDNMEQASVHESFYNTWDDGYPNGGNYWDDFSVRYPLIKDENQGENQDVLGSDGIWDSPYEIDVDNQDRYPLVKARANLQLIRQLTQQYFPYLIFDEDEEYFPTDFYYDDGNIDDNPSDYDASWPKTAYVHTVQGYWQEKEYLVIEYWFYYVRDNKTYWGIELPEFFGNHDHDWESIYVFLEKQGNKYIPSDITYFKHMELTTTGWEDYYKTYSWDHSWVEKMDGTHPIVHIARSSHGSYVTYVPIIDIGWPLYYFPEGIVGRLFPVPEPVDTGDKLNFDDFRITYVSNVDLGWPQERFGNIDAPWKRSRWDNPWYLLVPRPIENSLSVVVGSPVNILTIDPEGRRVGYDPETGTVVSEIPGATYLGPGSEPQLITIPDPLDGNYAVLLIGTATGTYSSFIELITSEGPISQTYTEETIENAVHVCNVVITYKVMTVNPDPVAELEHLREFLLNLPDDVFVTDDPDEFAEFKKEMFDKIDEALDGLDENKYLEAIEKLNDMKEEIIDEDKLQPTTQSDLSVISDHIISSIETFQKI